MSKNYNYQYGNQYDLSHREYIKLVNKDVAIAYKNAVKSSVNAIKITANHFRKIKISQKIVAGSCVLILAVAGWGTGYLLNEAHENYEIAKVINEAEDNVRKQGFDILKDYNFRFIPNDDGSGVYYRGDFENFWNVHENCIFFIVAYLGRESAEELISQTKFGSLDKFIISQGYVDENDNADFDRWYEDNLNTYVKQAEQKGITKN